MCCIGGAWRHLGKHKEASGGTYKHREPSIWMWTHLEALDTSGDVWTCLLNVWTCIRGAWTCILDAWTYIWGICTCILDVRTCIVDVWTCIWCLDIDANNAHVKFRPNRLVTLARNWRTRQIFIFLAQKRSSWPIKLTCIWCLDIDANNILHVKFRPNRLVITGPPFR